KGKAKPCKESQDRVAAVDSSGLCLFTTAAWGLEEFAQQIDAACDGDWTAERLQETGERIWNLERMFNLGAGLTAKDDTLPKRMLEVPAPAGAGKGKVNELGKMLPEYYEARGWTKDGRPSSETVARLGL
ncbi:MAG: aldehyde ferredoxin oxidoreductase C-terminal domain-containing protein, partial [Alphaproteobacteria bacterium]